MIAYSTNHFEISYNGATSIFAREGEISFEGWGGAGKVDFKRLGVGAVKRKRCFQDLK